MRLLILEDNADRRTAMLEHVADCLPMFAVEFFDSAALMIERVKRQQLSGVALISLDHDLEPFHGPGNAAIDAGTGLDVVQCLVEWSRGRTEFPVFRIPVIVHSSNDQAAEKMMDSLQSAGWSVSRIVPFDAERWVGETWVRKVRQLIVSGVTAKKESLLATIPLVVDAIVIDDMPIIAESGQ